MKKHVFAGVALFLTILTCLTIASVGSNQEVQLSGYTSESDLLLESVGENNNITLQQNETVEEKLMKICSSTYAYDYFATTESSQAYQTFYDRIDEKADSFFTDYTTDIPESGEIFAVRFSDLDLTTEEIIYVWNMYRNDNPLYYWIIGSISLDADNLYVITDADYYSAEARKEYNAILCEKLTEWLKATENETSPYRIALIYYDMLLNSMEYAYEDDGYTPSDDAWAHNILGVFAKGEGVCESYARAYSLLLNACAVENVFVTGSSNNEAHAWNMAKMDDGNWYWFDPTWDDPVKSSGYSFKDILGTDYTYFCVNDSQICESWNYSTGQSFLDSHTYNLPSSEGINCLYELPQRSTEKFESDGEHGTIKSVFTIDEMTYTVLGYNKVQLIEVSKEGKLVIPETVTYAGREYTVCSIGTMTNNIFDEIGSVIPFEASYSTITIPKTVRFIWGCSFRGGVEEYIVDEDNPAFITVDGVIFTKSMYTLVAYPSDSKIVKYRIPDETVRVASEAFYQMTNTNHIVIGKNVEIIGIANWGSGYLDDPTKNNGGNIIDSELGYIRMRIINETQNTISFSVHPDNKVYKEVDGVIYNYDMTRLIVVGDCFITELTIPNTVKIIDSMACFALKSLTKLVIPESLEWIASGMTFSYCDHLFEIYNYSNIKLTAGSSNNGEVARCARHIATSPDEPSRVFTTDDGFVYYYEEGEAPEVVAYTGTDTTVVLPESINGMDYIVGDQLLYGRYDIKELVVDGNIIGVYYWSFGHTWPEKITVGSDFVIANSMIRDNPNLKELVLLEGVSQLTWYMLYNCPAVSLIRTEMTAEDWIDQVNRNSVFIPDGCSVRCSDFAVIYYNGGYTTYKYGDVNGDGTVTKLDCEILMKYIIGWEVDVVEGLCDINGDGSVNSRDAALLLQFFTGYDVKLN